MNKLYNRIDWNNNTTPALNETNLNAMSKAIDDIDDRVIEISADVYEAVPELQEALEEVEQLAANPPYIGANGDWYIWDTETSAYVDSGVDASITVTIADVTMLLPDASPYVTNTGTDTDPVFHLFIPRGQSGTNGQDGVSPAVTITTITGGHRVNITDKIHPSGQNFDVMDGASQDISGKADKVTGATNGNFAGLDANGNLTDSGSKASDFKAASAHDAWTDVTSKPFNTVGDGLSVVSNALKVTNPVTITSSVSKVVGDTSVTFSNAAILTTSIVELFCENTSGTPIPYTSASISTGSATFNFAALTEATTFKARITN